MTSRILVVDDDTALAEMIGIVLRTEGFEPVFCADGAKAVEEWRSSVPTSCCSISCCPVWTASRSAPASAPSPAFP